MSDLIRRSELLKAMNTWDKFGCDKYGRLVMLDSASGKEYVPYVHYEDMVNCVKNMPTAYDMDKVVDELEIERKTANNTYNLFNIDVDLGRVFGLEKAIEIVKQDGVADD